MAPPGDCPNSGFELRKVGRVPGPLNKEEARTIQRREACDLEGSQAIQPARCPLVLTVEKMPVQCAWDTRPDFLPPGNLM